MSPDPESGQAFLICEFFTLDHAPTLQLGKSSSVPFSALNNQTHLDQFRLAGRLYKKTEKQLLPATQNSSSGSPPAAIPLGVGQVGFFSWLFAYRKKGGSFAAPSGERSVNCLRDGM